MCVCVYVEDVLAGTHPEVEGLSAVLKTSEDDWAKTAKGDQSSTVRQLYVKPI